MCLRASTTLALLLCFLPGSWQLSITEFDVPAAVQLGEDAELRCKYELDGGESEEALFVKWWVTPANADGDRAQLYQRIAGQPGVPIRSNLIIVDDADTVMLPTVTANDTGVYECEVSKIDEVRQHKQLTVFSEGSGPLVNVSEVAGGEEGDAEEVLVECRADDVAPAPDLVLTVDLQEYNMSELISGPDSDGLYDIAGNVTFSRSDVDGSAVRCELFYRDTTIIHPPYVHELIYDPSGALSTTAAAADDAAPDTTPATDYHSGESSVSRVSLAVAAAAALAQLL